MIFGLDHRVQLRLEILPISKLWLIKNYRTQSELHNDTRTAAGTADAPRL